jgi:import inner membrane translocase subunit TIM23
MSDIYRVSPRRELTLKQKDSGFFNRIKRHRVDPTASSLANPPPDYYGEKIGSVTGYRRWLKDQRAFNLKTGRYRGAKSF